MNPIPENDSPTQSSGHLNFSEETTDRGHHVSLRKVTLVSVCSFVLLVLQFVFQIVLARLFGAGSAMDAYVAAMALPTVASTILAGALSSAFLPRFTTLWQAEGADTAWRLAGSMVLCLLFATGCFALLCWAFARPLTGLLQPGLAGESGEQTIQLLRVLSWLVIPNGLIALLQTLHHSRHQFFRPAVAALLATSMTLLWTVMLHDRWGIYAVATGVLAGALLNALIQLPLVVRHARWQLRIDEHLAMTLRVMLPLMLAACFYQLDPLVDRYLASRLPSGSLSHLGYATRLTAALLLLSTSGLASVTFPVLATHAAAGRLDELRRQLAGAIRLLIVVLTPCVVGLVLFAPAVLGDLLQRGEFRAADTEAVAWMLTLYVGVLVGGSFGELLAKTLFALSDTKTPVVIGLSGFSLGVILKLWLCPRIGLAGIAVATSTYTMLSMVALLATVERRVGRFLPPNLAALLLKCTLGAAVGSVVIYAVSLIPVPLAVLWGVPAGIGVYALLLSWLGVPVGRAIVPTDRNVRVPDRENETRRGDDSQ